MYLPPLGLDLREHFKALHKEVETLSPAAQACVLYALQLKDPIYTNDNYIEVTPSMLVKNMGYHE